VWAWLKAQPKSDAVSDLQGMMLRIAGWKEPAVAMQWVKEVPDTTEGRRMVEQMFQSQINNGIDPAKLDDILAEMPENMRPALLARAFASEGDWKTTDFEPWIARMAELPAEQRPAAAGSLAARMAATDPQAAVAWASALTDENERRSAVGSVASRWANADSYDASQWVASLPPGGERDTAARALVNSIAQSDPESAWTWAVSIADATERSSALAAAFHVMRERDPQRARQLAQKLDPASTDRARMLDILSKPSSANAPR
jgi:hypothetical protein